MRRSLFLPILLLALGTIGMFVVAHVPFLWGSGWPGGQPLSFDQAAARVREYLDARGDPDLEPAELMEFSNHFYAAVREKSTGRHAFELLVERFSGAIAPEPGPNMMWNRKYGMMGSSRTGWFHGFDARPGRPTPDEPMPVTEQVARERALRLAASGRGGAAVGEPQVFYGYYTFDVLNGGNVTGMLSVNGYTGEVWVHRWHGRFIRMEEY